MGPRWSEDELVIGEYNDAIHAEVLDDLQVGEHGYKYRILDGLVVPPYVTPSRYRLSRSIETRPGDLCYVSYPKSGSTWLSYVVVLMVHGGEQPEARTLRSCLHWVESSWTYPRSKSDLDALPSPRIFKSHMPYRMALGGDPAKTPCRYIYIARNPKDVAVSYYFFERDKSWSGHYSGSWEHWLQIFLDGKVQRGDWFEHVLSWWRNSSAKNILFLKYEDLVRDSSTSVLARIAKHLGFDLSEAVLESIKQKVAFDEMRQNEFSNMHEIVEFDGFFRKGKIGSWKDQFTPAQSDMFDRVYAERMKGSGLEFDFE